MSYHDERLSDWAIEGQLLRHECGFSEERMAHAAGFPDVPNPVRHAPSVDHIIELVLREPIRSMHPDDLEHHRDYVRRVLAIVQPKR